MADREQLPHLIRLLDDESPNVRRHVVRELLAFGPELEEMLDASGCLLSLRQRTELRRVLQVHRNEAAFREGWAQWRNQPNESAQLETALELLARFQYGWAPPVSLSELLDDLADDFLVSGRPVDALSLARYLFVVRKIRGDLEHYYNPLNSNLVYVIQERRGIPITLVCLFMLVGRRLDIEIQGCNVPQHFLARTELDGRTLFFDCFNRGRVLRDRELTQLRNALGERQAAVLDRAVSVDTIIERVLNNLINAYELAEELERAIQLRQLLEDLRQNAPV